MYSVIMRSRIDDPQCSGCTCTPPADWCSRVLWTESKTLHFVFFVLYFIFVFCILSCTCILYLDPQSGCMHPGSTLVQQSTLNQVPNFSICYFVFLICIFCFVFGVVLVFCIFHPQCGAATDFELSVKLCKVLSFAKPLISARPSCMMDHN